MTPPELALWQVLRSRQLEGVRVRRQHPIGPWIVDVYLPAHRLALEVDGESHAMGDPDRDRRRDADLERRGFRVLRFTTHEVLKEMDGVVGAILAEVSGSSQLRAKP